MVVSVLLCHRRGRAGYDEYRHHFAKLIWQIASPKWNFDDATFDRTAAAFDNPDHVAIVIHDYRFRMALAEGERQYDHFEKQLAHFRPSPCPRLPSKAMPMVRHTLPTHSLSPEIHRQI